MNRVVRLFISPWLLTGREWFAAFEACLPRGDGGARAPVFLLTSTVAAWWVYVPVHELLHVLGCLLTGGEVHELQIAPYYGGALLGRLLPFVRSGGDYAGRLSGFDTGGSDFVYLATDATPYLLTLLGGFPLLRAAARRQSPLLFGPATVLLAAPALGLIGDFYEMGSILVSRALALARRSSIEGPLAALLHDDVFALLAEFPTRFPPPAWPGPPRSCSRFPSARRWCPWRGRQPRRWARSPVSRAAPGRGPGPRLSDPRGLRRRGRSWCNTDQWWSSHQISPSHATAPPGRRLTANVAPSRGSRSSGSAGIGVA